MRTDKNFTTAALQYLSIRIAETQPNRAISEEFQTITAMRSFVISKHIPAFCPLDDFSGACNGIHPS